MDFNLVDLAISIRTVDAFQLCLHLPMLGNAFAGACRESCCLCPEAICASCSRQADCAWNHVFGQQLSSDPSALRRFQKPPLPIVFTFPSRCDLAEGATEIECRLVVVGRAIQYLDMLLEGFGEILMPFDAQIHLVGTRDFQGIIHPLGAGSVIKYPENMAVLSIHDLVEKLSWTDTVVHIRMLSPLRLFEDGHLLRSFDFHRFAMSLLRRVSSLAYYYGAYEFDLDFKELSRDAAAVTCTDDHFIVSADKDRRAAGLTGLWQLPGGF